MIVDADEHQQRVQRQRGDGIRRQSRGAVRALRRGGMVGLLVCSGAEEQQALVELADVVVDGPDGVIELLDRLATDAAAGDDADAHGR